jgi:glycosyltransferase involved in cell wall biosynthesis
MGDTRKSVLLVTYDWPPSAEVGAVRVQKIARYLREHGWAPIILTVKESYYERVFTGKDASLFQILRTGCIPSPLKAYAYAKKTIGNFKTHNQLRMGGVQASVLKQSRGARAFIAYVRRLLLSMLFTPDEFLGWFPLGAPKAISAINNHLVSHVITSGPPFTTHLIGLMAKKWKGEQIKWTADFRDPWVANEQRPNLVTTPVSDYFNRLLEKQVICHADRIVCVTPAMTDWYRKRYPLVADTVWQTITNGFDVDDFKQIKMDTVRKRFIISYIGSIEYERSPAALLQAVSELCREGVIDKNQISIKFIGKCGAVQGRATSEVIREWGLEEVVELVGLVPRSQALKEMKNSHVLLLLANAQQLQVPGKAYEYIGAGSFILAVTEEQGATADFVRRVGGGAIVQPNDHISIKHVLQSRYKQFTENLPIQTIAFNSPRPTVILNEYEWRQLGARYAELLD